LTTVSEWNVDVAHGSLLVSGVPVPEGLVGPTAGLGLFVDGDAAAIPSWCETRSFWPDGSVRWLMLHARLPQNQAGHEDKRCRLVLTDEAPSLPGLRPACSIVPALAGEQLPGFDVFCDAVQIARVRQHIDSTLGASRKPFIITLVEDSPISPLFRVSNRCDGSVSTDYLVRVDPMTSSVHIASRFSWYGEGLFNIHSIRLDVSAGDGPGTLFRESRPEGGSREPGCKTPPDCEGQDLEIRNGSWVFTVLDGKRRGPVWLGSDEASPGSFRVSVEPDGGMEVMGGTSFRHGFRLCRDSDQPLLQIRWPDGALVRTGVFGPVAEVTSSRFENFAPGLALGVSRLIDRAVFRSSALEPPWVGLENDGDWPLNPGQYGAECSAYADNEYDAAYACYLAYVATNRADCLALALRCSAHMADVDFVCTTGDMRYHGYGNEADDHRGRRVACGDLGHYWTDGLWLAYFWSGDLFARESAEMLTRRVVSHFRGISPADDFAICERNLGWPLMVAVSEMETGMAQAGTKDFCRTMVEYLDDYTGNPDHHYLDPDAPVWWRCAMQDGCKPFMLGILNEALERLYRLTGDIRAQVVLGRIATYLMERLYEPMRMDFEYEQNAYGPGHRRIAAQSLIPLFVRGLLFTAQCNPAWPWRKEAVAALHASAWCLYDEAGGKEFALMTRGILPSLALADQLDMSEARAYRLGLPESIGQALVHKIFRSGAKTELVEPGLYSDAATLRMRYTPERPSSDSLNRQAFFHACESPPYRSALSVIAFHNRLQVRFYDRNGRLINSLDAFVDPLFFSPGKEHILEIEYRAPGRSSLRVDGGQVVHAGLDRPVSGSFNSIWTGSRPGNWSLDGTVAVDASFGPDRGATGFPFPSIEAADASR